MPTYDYACSANGKVVEVMHGIDDKVANWGELCKLTGADPGDTPGDAPVAKVISAPGLNFPKTNSELKNMGFTKLVRREKGVYENVTATGNESRYMNADDPSTMPDLKKKIGD
ncbi:MAG: zinc ribbon domain-containing protein [Acidobacteriota bacterium]|nr:zinc ribbon domain-containing protein [Acidobacteriota bacterium]